MAKGINKVILIGNLGDDPEMRYTKGGGAIANLSVATSEEWKDKDSGEKKDRTEWHKVVFFNKLGEVCGEYLKKGSKIYVEGKLATEKYTDKSGTEKYVTKIYGIAMQMLDNVPKGDGSYKPPAPDTSSSLDNFDDSDIPF